MSDERPTEGKISVRIPGVGVVRFPATMSDAEILKERDRLIYEHQNHGTAGKIVGTLAEMAGKSALPALGAAAGSLLGPPGAIVGGMAGEGANQAVGITPPSMGDVVISGAQTAGGLGAVRGAGALFRRFPGAPTTLHEMARDTLETIPGRFAPTRPSSDLYNVVEQIGNVYIPSQNLRKAATKLLEGEAKLGKTKLQNDQIREVAQGVLDESGQYAGQELPFQTLRAMLKRIGDRTGTMDGKTPDEVRGAYKLLMKSGLDDMEAAVARGNPAQPAVQALREANAARKAEHVVEDLGDYFSVKGGGLTFRPDLAQGNGIQVNFVTILKNLEKDVSIRKSMGDAAYEQMTKEIKTMANKTPGLGAPKGVDAGSRNVMTRGGLMYGAGSTVGYLFGGGTGAAVGGPAAVAGGIALHKILGALVSTSLGRSALRSMLEANHGILTTDMLAAVAPAVGMTETGRDISHFGADTAQGIVGGLTQ